MVERAEATCGVETLRDAQMPRESQSPRTPQTLRACFRAVRARLEQAGVEDAAFDAAQLLQHVTGLDYRVQPDAALTPPQAQALQALANRRAAREPLQYLLGTWDFLDFTLKVGPGVLIPRADTEIVCETAIAAVQAAEKAAKAAVAGAVSAPCAQDDTTDARATHVLDLCAGSGAIAIGVARAVPSARVTAVELSDAAFSYLTQNCAALAPRVTLVKADVFTWQKALPAACVDVIVSNPPYITAQELQALAPELAFEPRMALEAAENGLAFYRHIARAYRAALRPGGALVLEIGSAQAAAVSEILRENGYVGIAVYADAAGLARCVQGRKAH